MKLIKKLIPRSVKLQIISLQRAIEDRRNRKRSVSEVFTDIYARHQWGDRKPTAAFDSGHGTGKESVARPYLEAIKQDLQQRGLAGTHAVDLGCGDYRIGRELRPLFGRYMGVDIVPSLVQHLNEKFSDASTTFVTHDLIVDDLPDGDVAFLRQVLQHLSNSQILKILAKLTRYRVTYITEHHPSDDRLIRPNVDKVHGGGIRLFKGSGVYLDQPPFSNVGLTCSLIAEVPGHGFSVDTDPGIIRTYAVTKPRKTNV